MTEQTPATKVDIERIEAKLDHILGVIAGILEILKPLQTTREGEAVDWNKAVPPAGEYDEGAGI
jgi:hypothetical protein